MRYTFEYKSRLAWLPDYTITVPSETEETAKIDANRYMSNLFKIESYRPAVLIRKE